MVKKTEKDTSLDQDFFNSLIESTDFQIASTGSLMHSRFKVETPLTVLNCIYGGGMPMGIMCEVSGVNQSGKSTFLYQCMANYQKQCPNGIPIVLDMETSMDTDRLEELGVDTSRVLRLGSRSIEQTFANLFKVLNKIEKGLEDNKDLSAFIVYDSLASGGTDSEQKAVSEGKSAFGAGAMREDTRSLKHNLQNLFPYMEKMPIFIGLINQVFVHPNPYGGPSKLESGGGTALKHLCHTHIVFSNPRDDYENSFLIGTESKMELHKSKLSPKMINIPVYLDGTKGGKIDETDSFVKYITDKNVGLVVADSWYKFSDAIKVGMFTTYPELSSAEDLKKILSVNYRKKDFYNMVSENKDLCALLQIALIDFLCNIYPAQKIITESYKAQLISDCAYFKA